MDQETRGLAELKQHYAVEKELATVLRNSRKEDRARLYSQLYSELFRRVPSHPQLRRIQNPREVSTVVSEKMALLRPLLRPDTVFLELGAGDCRLTLEVARHVRKAYALDVSEIVHQLQEWPANCDFVLSKGTDIPVPEKVVTLAYSYQLMEHIHPDDALEQLSNIYETLAPGGTYICITPNRLTGPHDVSRHFDVRATGFHLREYALAEAAGMFVRAGFDNAFILAGCRGRFMRLPVGIVAVFESCISLLPWRARKMMGKLPLVRNLLTAAVVAQKA